MLTIFLYNIHTNSAKQYRADSVDVVSYGCVIRRTHQLPCAHEIAGYQRSDQSIPIDVVHSQWRRLDVGHFAERIDSQEKFSIKPHLAQLQQWLEEQDDETKRQILVKIDKLINPGSTVLKEPNEKIKTKGRPSKIDTSTRRLPSAFEIADALLPPKEKVVNASPSSILPSTKLNDHPEKNQVCNLFYIQ